MTDTTVGSITKKFAIPANAVIVMMRPVSTVNATLMWDILDASVLATSNSVALEVLNRANSLSILSNAIMTETISRIAADNTITLALSVESNARVLADSIITNSITNEIISRLSFIASVSNTVSTEMTNLSLAVAQEISLRSNTQSVISNSITLQVSNRISALSNITITLPSITNTVSNVQSRANDAYVLASSAAIGNVSSTSVYGGTETIYTASGNIASSDSSVIINSPVSVSLTLPNGIVNGRQVYIKRIGLGNAIISASLDTMSTTFILNSPNGSESLLLEWDTYLTTWLIRSFYHPGLKTSDLSGVILGASQKMIVFETDGTPRKTSIATFARGVTASSLAFSATTPIAPSNVVGATPITGLTTVLTPNTATAYAVLYNGISEIGSRVSFNGNTIPALTPSPYASNTLKVLIYSGATGGVPLTNSEIFGSANQLANSATLSGFPTMANSYASINLTGYTVSLIPNTATAYAALYNGSLQIGTRTSFTGTTPPTKTTSNAGTYTYQIYTAASGGTLLTTSNTITVNDIIATNVIISGFPTIGNANSALSIELASITISPTGATAYAALSDGSSEIGSRSPFAGSIVPTKTPPTPGNYTYQIFSTSTGGSPLVISNTIMVSNARAVYDLTFSGASYDTSTAKFGQGLSGGYGSSPNTILPTAGANAVPLTYECWFQCTDPTASGGIITSEDDGLSNTQGIGILLNSGVIYAKGRGSTIVTSQQVCDGNKHHLALVWNPDGSGKQDLRLFYDGILLNGGYYYLQWTPGLPVFVRMGNFGTIDEVRISNSARYNNSFTPPTTLFTRDANTLAIWHLDGNGISS